MRKYAALGAALFALAWMAGAEDKKEPFYRSYLVPGNALDDKIRAQEKRVEADPISAALRNDFGNLLAARRFVGDARKQYKEAMKLDKNQFLAPYNLGLLEETDGRTGAAISAYKESINRKPGFPPSRFHLGRLYEKTGSPDRAIEQYARALRIDPSMRDPRRNPLAGDTRLLDRVSLTNYERDIATAAIGSQARYVDEGRFGKTPVNRTLYADEVGDATVAAPTPTALRPAAAGPAPGAPGAAATGAPPASGAPAIVVPETAPTATPVRRRGSRRDTGVAPPPPPAPTPTPPPAPTPTPTDQ